MSRWIRGRLGRPMASIISLLMLVSLLLPLAPPPVQAQGDGTVDWSKFTDAGVVETPTPLAVLDFYNRSEYKTGMLGREMSDALSLSMQSTGKFSVAQRKDVDAAMQELGLSVPMDITAQAMLADRVNVPFAISGEIEKVIIDRTKDGTYAQVTVNALVVSRVTRLPINGARVTQKSSPKLGYVANTDALVNEAISTAAYQMAQEIIDNRIPMATVLTPPREDGEVRLRGGSVTGLVEGMQVATVRQNSVSGILRVIKVGPTDAVCRVIEDHRGIAPSDRVVPVYTFNEAKTTPQARKKTTQTIVAVLGLAALAALVGHSSSENNASSSPVDAFPMANAGQSGYTDGANVVRWSAFGSKDVLAYIVYREVPAYKLRLPIEVVPVSRQNRQVIDIASSLIPAKNRKVVYTFTLDPVETNINDCFSFTQAPSDVDDLPSVAEEWNDDKTELTITVVYPPFTPSASSRSLYSVCAIYRKMLPLTVTPGGSTGTGTGTGTGTTATEDENIYELGVSDFAYSSTPITPTEPPEPYLPTNTGDDVPTTGVFQCKSYQTLDNYVLQISNSSTFPTNGTMQVKPELSAPASTSTGNAVIYAATTNIDEVVALDTDGDGLWVRWGGSITANPAARADDPGYSYCNGYVFSKAIKVSVKNSMLTSLLMQRGIQAGMTKSWDKASFNGRNRNRRLLGR